MIEVISASNKWKFKIRLLRDRLKYALTFNAQNKKVLKAIEIGVCAQCFKGDFAPEGNQNVVRYSCEYCGNCTEWEIMP